MIKFPSMFKAICQNIWRDSSPFSLEYPESDVYPLSVREDDAYEEGENWYRGTHHDT
jgi:hypothetical protein